MIVLALGQLAIPVGRAMFADAPFFEALVWSDVLIFVAVGLFVVFLVWRIFGPPPAARKEFRDAPSAVATIVATRTTGVEMNDQPELHLTLDIDTPDGGTLRGFAKEVVPHDQLALVVVGARVPVRYLPDGRAAVTPEINKRSHGEIEDTY